MTTVTLLSQLYGFSYDFKRIGSYSNEHKLEDLMTELQTQLTEDLLFVDIMSSTIRTPDNVKVCNQDVKTKPFSKYYIKIKNLFESYMPDCKSIDLYSFSSYKCFIIELYMRQDYTIPFWICYQKAEDYLPRPYEVKDMSIYDDSIFKPCNQHIVQKILQDDIDSFYCNFNIVSEKLKYAPYLNTCYMTKLQYNINRLKNEPLKQALLSMHKLHPFITDFAVLQYAYAATLRYYIKKVVTTMYISYPIKINELLPFLQKAGMPESLMQNLEQLIKVTLVEKTPEYDTFQLRLHKTSFLNIKYSHLCYHCAVTEKACRLLPYTDNVKITDLV